MSANNNTSTTDQVYQKIRNAITSGYFHPGERLVERDLAQLIGVSRTPVREALKRLERERFVTTVPFRGVMVTKLSLEEAEQVYQIRSVLEGFAASLAAGRPKPVTLERLRKSVERTRKALEAGNMEEMAVSNNEFHEALAEGSGNRFLCETLANLRALIDILRLSSWRFPGRSIHTLQEHEELLGALEKGEPELARQIATKHVENAWEVACKVLKSEQRFFQMIGAG